jgi:hypothetical protein
MADTDSHSADSVGAGAPADKIEVTAEMRQVGAELIAGHFHDVISESFFVEELASEVYQAMERRRLLSPSELHEQSV